MRLGLHLHLPHLHRGTLRPRSPRRPSPTEAALATSRVTAASAPHSARAGIPDTLDALAVPIDSLKPYGRNPRQGDVGAIIASLERHGQYRPIVVNTRTSEVLAGNHTLQAARALGWTEIAATFVDVDEDTAARIVLIDNRSNDLAAYDDHALVELLQSLPDLDGTGFDGDALDELLADLAGSDARTSGDTDPIDPPAEPRTKPGDLYVLGDHRLLCGDSREVDAAASVLEGGMADAMWTDPPYGVSYVGKTKDALTIQNDGADGLDSLLQEAFATALTVLSPGAAVYCAHPPGERSVTFANRFSEAFQLRQGLVWAKNTMVLGHSDYHYSHEPILYGYVNGYQGRRGRGGEGWYGDNSQTSVLQFDKPSRSEEHPTSKPVELVEACLTNSTKPGDLVYEPFCGSGSTLIACENLGRACRALELDPGYCDVIVDRWERHTGKKAALDAA